MESYVVRIYRRDPKEPRRLVGVVEQAGAEGEQAFRDLDELLALLTPKRTKWGFGKSVKGERETTDR